ncbi:unnamed protein product [Phaedon cochleariae]|uniref:Uncharacterized protein n=1 Tax=Phaedon cochleariae TaxID=80249 RepID=A0A9P0DFL6_PHACE|nr:unnamed protein product [Phaedon cochleariae]
MYEEAKKCEVCQKQASHKCGGCHNVYYCCKEHQRSGWKSHKNQCRPYKVCTDDILGRHLVATKDIKPGDLVLQEPPLIWGPAQVTIPVCLGCGMAVDENSRPCSKCGWPMCSEICEKAPAHIPECRYTVMRGDKVSIRNFGMIHPSYQSITVLRMLYQKQFLPEVWKKIDLLESHCEKLKNTQKYQQERIMISQFIQRFFKLKNVFTEEEIMKACGIVMVNSHEVPLTNPPHISIYERASMLEHNCSANCSKSFTDAGGLMVRAGSRIQKGEHLSICYTDPLWGTPSRRHHLQESKLFWCACARCVDPTEFQTYFSALRCQDSSCEGNLLPKSFIDNTTNEKGPDWFCDRCPSVLSSYSVQDILERIGKDLADMPKGSVRECRSFVRTYSELLHKNHYYLTDVKIALSELIGQEDDCIAEVCDEDVELKARVCRELIDLMERLIPGEKRVKGLILFELHAAIMEIGKRKGDPESFYAALMSSREILSEAIEILKYEPDGLPEGRIYKQAVTNLHDLEAILRTVHKTMGDNPL